MARTASGDQVGSGPAMDPRQTLQRPQPGGLLLPQMVDRHCAAGCDFKAGSPAPKHLSMHGLDARLGITFVPERDKAVALAPAGSQHNPVPGKVPFSESQLTWGTGPAATLSFTAPAGSQHDLAEEESPTRHMGASHRTQCVVNKRVPAMPCLTTGQLELSA